MISKKFIKKPIKKKRLIRKEICCNKVLSRGKVFLYSMIGIVNESMKKMLKGDNKGSIIQKEKNLGKSELS
ncbi:MAG: hypothetical protein BAJALOKI2v1_130020 [Promethearchaeota archaeon]|nr:MAG: hypothetical protein BAJALOKI2v1_130020 [Candidatus Lokiarchaeota archaeon]